MSRGAVRTTTRAVLLVAALLAVLLPAPTWAHSELERSDPLDGAVVPVGRDTVTLWFGEPVALASSTFVLRAEDGASLPVRTRHTGGATRVVELVTEPLTRQTYALEWRVFSVDDGHTSSGTLTFGAGVRPDPPTSRGTRYPPAALLLVRWADLAALIVAIGALAVGDRVLRPLGARPRRRARTLAWAAALTVVYAGALTPFLRAFDLGRGPGLWWDQTVLVLTQTTWGWLWLVREAAAVVALGAILVWARRAARPRTPARVAWGALGVVAALESWAGHASSLHDPGRLTAVAGTAHLLGAGVWAGGLAVLVVCTVPALRSRDGLGSVVAAWRAFSPLAAASSGVLLATGLYEAGRQLPDLGSVTSTLYGGVVAGKTVLVVGALVLAGLNTLMVHPGLAARIQQSLPAPLSGVLARRDGRGLVRTTRAEAVLLGTAVALAAVLVTSPTAREEIDARRATTVHVERVDGLFVTFEEVAAGPGSGRLVVRLRAVVRPDPAPVERIEVALAGPGGQQRTVALDEVAPDRYEARTREPGPGRWTAGLRLHRAGGVLSTAHTSWTVPARASEEAGPLRVATTSLAAVLLIGVLAAGYRRWRRPGPGTGAGPVAPSSITGPGAERPRELSGSSR